MNSVVHEIAHRDERATLNSALLSWRAKNYSFRHVARTLLESSKVRRKLKMLAGHGSPGERSCVRSELRKICIPEETMGDDEDGMHAAAFLRKLMKIAAKISKISAIDPGMTTTMIRQRKKRKLSEHVIEQGVPLSKSKVWTSSSNYYSRQGSDAWETDVPFRATSNSFVAKRYASFIVKLFKSKARVNIVEVGAGHCMLSHQLALCLKHEYPEFEARCIATDFNVDILKSRMRLPCFSAFAPDRLDFAALNICSCDHPLVSLSDGLPIDLDATPTVFIANYLVDSTPHDLYRTVRRGGGTQQFALQRGVVTSYASNAEAQYVHLDSVIVDYDDIIQRGEVGDGLKAAAVHAEKIAQKHDASCVSFLFPSMFVRAMNMLCSNRKNPACLIVTDKPYFIQDIASSNVPERVRRVPAMDQHGTNGCVSVGVDFAILHKALNPRNCLAATHNIRSNVVVSAHWFGSGLPTTFYDIFEKCFEGFGISDYELVTGLLLEHRDAQAFEVLDFLEEAGYDFEIFKHFAWSLLTHANKARLLDVAAQCFERRCYLNEQESNEQTRFYLQWSYACGSIESFQRALPPKLDTQTAIMVAKLCKDDDGNKDNNAMRITMRARVARFIQQEVDVLKADRKGRRLLRCFSDNIQLST